jgi:hypothetical protein
MQIERLTAALKQSNERNKELAALIELRTKQFEQQKTYIQSLSDWANEAIA